MSQIYVYPSIRALPRCAASAEAQARPLFVNNISDCGRRQTCLYYFSGLGNLHPHVSTCGSTARIPTRTKARYILIGFLIYERLGEEALVMVLRKAVQRVEESGVIRSHLKRRPGKLKVGEEMVGTARFELATSRTPSVRATRL